MKIFIIALTLLIGNELLAQSSIYKINLQTIDGKTINFSDYQGKKIMLASVSPEIMKAQGLRFYDSIQKINKNLVIIIIPASDFGGSRNSEIINAVKSDTVKHVPIATLSPVKKDKGASQNSVMKWVTSTTGNTHFNDDIQTDMETFLISESGILYAMFAKGASLESFKNALAQVDVKQ